MNTVHTHQHRLDHSHNFLLLLIPGLIFIIIIGLYLILRIQVEHVNQDNEEIYTLLDKSDIPN